MAQAGYTPIQLYFSTTAAAVPLAANLAQGELAINIADGKLYYENSSGVVTLLASSTTVTNSFSAGTTGFTPSTATTGAVTLGGTLITSNGGTGLASYTAGDLSYYASGTALTKLAIGTAGQILTSSGTAPQWSTLSGVAVTTFSAGTTGFTPSSATAGAVTLAGTLATTNGGTGLTAFTANQVFYASSTSAFAQSANLTFNGTTLTANTIGAFTLSGTISGGGNQINNVIIGTTTPLAGAFTTLSATGQITGRTTNGAVFVTSNGNDADFVLSLASGLVTQNVTGSLQLQTGGSNRAVISSTGLEVTGTGSYTGNLSVGATATGKFLAYQATAIQNNQGAYGSSGTFQTGTGSVTLGGGANPRGIGVLINANRNAGTTLTYGNNFETFGLLAVANVGTGGGYGTTGVAGYAESDGGVYGLRADAKTTSVGGASIAVGLYVGSVTGSSTNYGVYVADTDAVNYFGGSVGINGTLQANYGPLQVYQLSVGTESSLGFIGTDNAVISSKYSLVFQIDSLSAQSGRAYTWKHNGKGYTDGDQLMLLDADTNQLRVGTNQTINDIYSATIYPGVVSSNGLAAIGLGNAGSTSRISKIFSTTPGNTYTVRVYPSNSVYAITDIRGGGYNSGGSGNANAFFSYGGHVGGYQLNTVFNTYTGNITVSAPTVGGSYIEFTVTITGGSAGQYIVMVDDAGISADKMAYIVVV